MERANCAFVQLFCLLVSRLALPLDTEETLKPWIGPIADHQLGVHPSDTPEVSLAKTQHLRAYAMLLEEFPEWNNVSDEELEREVKFHYWSGQLSKV